MTSSIILEQAFRNKARFSELMSQSTPVSVSEVLSTYPTSDGKVIIQVAELTQNFETLLNSLGDSNIPNLQQAPYLVWIVTQEKENVMNVLKTINKHATDGFGIFVFKASLNDNKIEFNCLLKPDKKSLENNFTYAKEIQNRYWQKYFEICDEIGSDMQVSPKYQHWQYLGMGKKGVGLMLSVSTKLKYIGADLIINYNKSIYEKLLLNKDEIEKELDELEWINIPNNKSSKIRKTLDYDVNNENQVEEAIKEHIKLAESFKSTFSKYL